MSHTQPSNAHRTGNQPESMARNLIANYGREGFRRLIEMLREGASGAAIGREFDVSRERARQWRNALGKEVRHYEVKAEVARLLAPPTPPDSRQ